MERILLTVVFGVLVSTMDIGAQSTGLATTPPTKLEAFIANRGELLVKEFYQLGAFTAETGSMRLDAVVAYQPGREQQRLRGLRVEVASSGRTEDTQTSFLDLEEVESLATALAYLADAESKKKGTTDLTIAGGIVAAPPYTEFEFSTRGDFRVGFYRDTNETRGYAMSGHIAPVRVFFKPADLTAIKSLVDKASIILKSK